MGFFSKLKNTLTGGWATVTVECEGAGKRGERLPFKVNVEVKDNPISVDRIYVELQCAETVEIDRYRTLDQDDAGDVDYVNVRHSEDLLEEKLVIADAQELAANGSFSFNGEIDIPAHLPPSYRGKNCAIKWLIYAGLDMTGNDPDSGWKEITVN
jgi:hypothetical protein